VTVNGEKEGESMSIKYLDGVSTAVLCCVTTALTDRGYDRRDALVHHNSWVLMQSWPGSSLHVSYQTE
jgi:hypothetical protein